MGVGKSKAKQAKVPAQTTTPVVNETETPVNLPVTSFTATSRHYSNILPNSLGFFEASGKHVKPRQHRLRYYCMFQPRSGFQVNGYAFLSTPIFPADSTFKFVIQLKQQKHVHAPTDKLMAIGFTSCDPKTISWVDLPYKNIDDLDNRKEYWVWNDRFATEWHIPDELCITVNATGQVLASGNGVLEQFLFSMDRSIPIWPFFALLESLTEIAVLGKIPVQDEPIENLPADFPSAPLEQLFTLPRISLPSSGSQGQSRGQRSKDQQKHKSEGQSKSKSQSRARPQSASTTRPSAKESKTEKSKTDQKEKKENSSDSLCIICYEREKNCIFVPCAHNCMCFACGNEYFQQKKTEARAGQNPECPICRAQSTSVMQIFNS